jgi:predicted nucleotidyltransferase component of viral defense system
MLNFEQIKEKAREEGVSTSLVLKEQIHFLVLEYLFKEGVFEHLVFQGGTALRIVYQGVRYSEDLDFVVRRKSLPFWKDIAKILTGLPAYLDKFIFFAKEVELKVQKRTPTFQRYSLLIGGENVKPKDRTSIEIANVPSYENQTLMIRNESIPVNPAIRVETPQEILSDKFCAFGSRPYVKGRDLWDFDFLLQTMKQMVNQAVKQMVVRKISDYRSRPILFLNRFRKNLSILKTRGAAILKMEMEKFLPMAYQKAYREQYPMIIERVGKSLMEFYDEIKKK